MEFVLVPGAWAGDWIWSEVSENLERTGYKTHLLTLSGLEENSQGSTDLNTHVEDVESYIRMHDLKDVALVGHSYSGIVVGQVASRGKVSVSHTIFIEAFLPVSGQSLLEVSGLPIEEEKKAIDSNQGMWPAPTAEELESQPHLNQAQKALLVSKQRPHPGNTVTDRAELETPLSEISATFIAHEGWLSSSREHDLVDQLRRSSTWQFRTINGGHWPMLTIPQELVEKILSGIP
ncbi:alpha/beta hydrolase [Microbulbifer celer]|uniref:Alpha/beta hydrolase n=1 Tax=Microbulbifer celer TaxID=435905 RepID=A0ABW3U9L4_9GAMM|nr:alpha/beta hydrolase [Microbulbifer celer]UFN56470.1 alpha/beta hydrolase [Microbulbifer celer]